MAVFKRKCANTKVKINNYDHLPPHCHVNLNRKNVLINIKTISVIRPDGATIPGPLRKCLKDWQTEMLEAWERVQIIDDDRV